MLSPSPPATLSRPLPDFFHTSAILTGCTFLTHPREFRGEKSFGLSPMKAKDYVMLYLRNRRGMIFASFWDDSNNHNKWFLAP
jgi:hypothetical protein